MYSLLNKEKSLDCVYFDFKKAFDSIDHRLLCSKLPKYGFDKQLLKWIENYLRDRTQIVCVGSSFSQEAPVRSGVPQGSCIGPLLFILYINDVTETISPNVFAGIYADDLKLFSGTSNHDDIQKSIDSVHDWAVAWNMQLSIPKCSVLNIGSNNNNQPYYLNGVVLKSEKLIRDLGIYMNQSLTFDDHVHQIVHKAKSRMNNILRVFRCTDLKFLTHSFVVFVRPLLESATEVWNVTSTGLISEIEGVQRKFTRRALIRARIPYSNYEDRLHICGLELLERRRETRDLTFIFKTIHEITSYDSSFAFSLAPLGRTLRGAHRFRIKLPFTIPGVRRSTFASRAISHWNGLGPEIFDTTAVAGFRRRIKLNLNA